MGLGLAPVSSYTSVSKRDCRIRHIEDSSGDAKGSVSVIILTDF